MHIDIDYFNYFLKAKESLLRGTGTADGIITRFFTEFGDSDNSYVITCATEILESLGILKGKFRALKVGPDRVGQKWDLWKQIVAPLHALTEEQRYVFFSIPTFYGKHSVAAVIDRETKQIFYIDSKKTLGAGDAQRQLKGVRDYLLHEYTIVDPPQNCVMQQQDDYSCGIHSTANIIGIILNQEQWKPEDVKKKTAGMIEPIDLQKNVGIETRTNNNILSLILVCCLANEQYTQKLSAKNAPVKMNYRQKQAIKFALKDIQEVLTEGATHTFKFKCADSRNPGLDGELVSQANETVTELRKVVTGLHNHSENNIENNLSTECLNLLLAFSAEVPSLAVTMDRLNPQSGPGRALEAFINSLKAEEKYSGNLFLSWLQSLQISDCLPKSGDDNIEYKEKELFINFVNYVKDLYTVEHKDEEGVISNHPRSGYSNKDNGNLVVNNSNNEEEIEEKEEKHEEEKQAQKCLGDLYGISKELCEKIIKKIKKYPWDLLSKDINDKSRYGRFDFSLISSYNFFKNLNSEIESLKERLEAKVEKTLIADDLKYVSADQHEVKVTTDTDKLLQYKNKDYDKGSSPETIYETLRKLSFVFMDHPKNIVGDNKKLQTVFVELAELIVFKVSRFKDKVYQFKKIGNKLDYDISKEEQETKMQLGN